MGGFKDHEILYRLYKQKLLNNLMTWDELAIKYIGPDASEYALNKFRTSFIRKTIPYFDRLTFIWQLDEKQKENLINDYNNGLTNEEISMKYNYNINSTRIILKELLKKRIKKNNIY